MKNYDKSFREEAVKMSDEIGGKRTSENLGVPVGTIYSWRKELKRGDRTPKAKREERGERAEYERRIRELEEANEILRKAMVFS